MWQAIESRIAEHERKGHVPLRIALFSIVQKANLTPVHDTHYMVAFEFGEHDRLLWELTSSARNFFLHAKWREPGK